MALGNEGIEKRSGIGRADVRRGWDGHGRGKGAGAATERRDPSRVPWDTMDRVQRSHGARSGVCQSLDLCSRCPVRLMPSARLPRANQVWARSASAEISILRSSGSLPYVTSTAAPPRSHYHEEFMVDSGDALPDVCR